MSDQTLLADTLLRCVAECLAADDIEWLPARALIIYEALDEDGDSRLGYASTDMSATDIVGVCEWVKTHKLKVLTDQDDE